MPITRCPGCQSSLEVPAVVPGGLVACPYCETEFAVSGGGGRSRRGAHEPEDRGDDGYGRGGFRKRTDPVPIIILVASVLVLAGVGIFFLVKHGQRKDAASDASLAEIAAKDEARFNLNIQPDQPQGDPITMYCDFRVGDMLTFKELAYTSGLSVTDHNGNRTDLQSLTYRMVSEEHGEKIVSVSGDESTHEGRYELQGYYLNANPIVANSAWLDARFRTGRMGNLIPGSFEITGGAKPSPVPEFLGERSFGILPTRAVRYNETWGTDKLPNPFADHIDLGGIRFDQIPLIGSGRQGGWKIAGGTFEKREDGSWTRQANATLRLFACENRAGRGGTYRGQDIRSLTAAVRWQGTAHYELMKNYPSRLEDVRCEVNVVLKTDTAWWEWKGTASTSYSMYKDP